MLTDIEIKALLEKDVQGKRSDSGGLFLHLQGKRRTWRLAYRFGGIQRTITFGEYPSVSLAAARKMTASVKMQLAQGVDPQVLRQQERDRALIAAGTTFELVGKEWQSKRALADLSASAHRKDAQMLDRHAYQTIGERPISTITAPEILALIRTIEAKKQYETAHRLRATISRVFRYAIATGRAERDPAADLIGALVVHKTKHHAALFDPRMIGEMMRAIHGYTGFALTRIALMLQAHLFVRPGELRHAEWTEVDLQKRWWRIPDAKMKMGRDHIVPLSDFAVEQIEALRKMAGQGRYLFPSVLGGSRPMSNGTVNSALRRLGYTKDEVVAHGFRRTASTVLNESGLWRPDVVELQLAHVDSSVRGIYNAALYLDERTKMMTWYSDWLEAQRREGERVEVAVDPIDAILG